MAHGTLTDLMDSYNAFSDWVLNGGENEDLGDSLEAELKDCAKNFFFNGDDIDDSSIDFANANSDLNVQIVGKAVRFSVPNSSKEYDVRDIQVYA